MSSNEAKRFPDILTGMNDPAPTAFSRPRRVTGAAVGYGRVSNREQNLARQRAVLTAVGCANAFFDKV